MSEPFGASIEFRSVSKSFPGTAAPALTELTLRIEAGELMVLVGPSGCGKTTTLRLINRLIEPTSGAVLVDGAETTTHAVEVLRRDIGYVIQHVGLFPHRTIAQNIATVPKLLGWSASTIAERVEELAAEVGLDHDLLRRYPAELSGGQQQRVGVARALAARPRILLMDEPFSAVDPIVRSRLQDELARLHQRVGTTIVLVTHDIDEAVRLGDRVAVFATGRLAQVATPDALMAAPADAFVESFLGADRSLRRLALRTLGQLVDRTHTADAASEVRLDAGLPGRSAVDALLASGADRVAVTESGRVVGHLTLAALTRLLATPDGHT
ncbi:MAG TPA: ABC transporter ATP-binding protein [Microthrixaceae bacterium]|nr:ABC transporter ATP-binding protein [Microthrixaceae bacterium]